MPHLVVTRAGNTWLGTPEGVEVEVKLSKGYTGGARPGDVAAEWRIDPPGEAASVNPAGDVILALSDEAAFYKRSALDELQKMQQAVIQATRRIEIDVLGVVTAADPDGLDQLNQAHQEADDALRSLVESAHVIDGDYMEQFGRAAKPRRPPGRRPSTAGANCSHEPAPGTPGLTAPGAPGQQLISGEVVPLGKHLRRCQKGSIRFLRGSALIAPVLLTPSGGGLCSIMLPQ